MGILNREPIVDLGGPRVIKVGDVFTLMGFGKELDTLLVLEVWKEAVAGKTGVVVNVKNGNAAPYYLRYLDDDNFGFIYKGNMNANPRMLRLLYGNE